jgi:hypothetical protein
MTTAAPVSAAPVAGPPAWRWFLAWSAVGAAYCFALLAVLSIGIFVLPIPVIATILLARSGEANRGATGILSGAALPLLWVAYLNRGGPGDVCTTTGQFAQGGPGAQSCTQEVSPWPWFALGVAVLLSGVAIFTRQRRRSRSAASRTVNPRDQA